MPLWHQSWDFQQNTKELSLDCSQAQSSGGNYSPCRFCVYPATLHGSSTLILFISLFFEAHANPLNSAKRMYYPQTYHHIQEIQKYNIQDYRPRYVTLPLGHLFLVIFHANTKCAGWSNSKKPSARFGKYNACENSVGMLSRKQTSRRQEYCKRTIPREREVDMEKWRVRDPRGGEDDSRCLTRLSVYATVFRCSILEGITFRCFLGLG